MITTPLNPVIKPPLKAGYQWESTKPLKYFIEHPILLNVRLGGISVWVLMFRRLHSTTLYLAFPCQPLLIR